jgi:DHA2 family multidrug resistance protein
LTTLLSQRVVFHRAIMLEHISTYSKVSTDRLDFLTQGLRSRGTDQVTAHKEALKVVSGSISQQAAIMSFNDIFRVVGFAFVFSLPLLLLMGKASKEPIAAPVDH